jgi:hypothetical protein
LDKVWRNWDFLNRSSESDGDTVQPLFQAGSLDQWGSDEYIFSSIENRVPEGYNTSQGNTAADGRTEQQRRALEELFC